MKQQIAGTNEPKIDAERSSPSFYQLGFEIPLLESIRYLYKISFNRDPSQRSDASKSHSANTDQCSETIDQKKELTRNEIPDKLLSPLMNAEFKPLSQKLDKARCDLIEADVSTASCIGKSVLWAWEAGRKELIIKLAAAASLALLPYGLSYTSARGIDALMNISLGKDSISSAYGWFCMGSVASLALLAVNAANNWYGTKHKLKNEQVVAADIRKALTGFSVAEHNSPEVTQLVNRTRQSQFAMQNFGKELFDLIVPSVSLLSATAIVAPYSSLGACGLACFSLINLFHSYKRGKAELAVSEALSEPSNRYGSREYNFVSGPGQVEFMLHGKSRELLEHLNVEREKLDRARIQPELDQQTRDLWVQPLNTVMLGSIGFVILQRVIDTTTGFALDGISIGQFGLITGALYSLNASIRSMSSSVGTILRSLPQAQLAHAVIKKGLSKQEIQSPVTSNLFEEAPSILVRNVVFEYPATDENPSKKVLRGISFTVEPGELLAIVGQSGSGKTSLVNILSGVYDQSEGEIYFDGNSLSADNKRNFWANSGYLRQSSQNLFSLTLRENIMLGAKELCSDAALMKIAEETGFAQVMRENKLTLDTVLGQWYVNGKNLSGGQLTLLAMTRQAATDGKFLILDEPTAGLDAGLADGVIKRLCKLKGTTRILISHDYGIANKADRILVLANGVVDGIGTHDELLTTNVAYRSAYDLQVERLARKQ